LFQSFTPVHPTELYSFRQLIRPNWHAKLGRHSAILAGQGDAEWLSPGLFWKAGDLQYCAISDTAWDELLGPVRLLQELGARDTRR
jgi:hypothetical protein